MSHFLNEEEKLLRNAIREFVEDEVAPVAASMAANNEFPDGLMRRAGELGLLGITMPEQYGGLDMGETMAVVAVEEVAKQSPTLAVAMDVQYLMMGFINIYASEEQKQRWLVPAIAGEKILAVGWTEAQGCTNSPEYGPSGAFDGEDFVLDVTKTMVTSASVADIEFVQSVVPGKGIGWCAVPKGAEGVEYDIYKKIGMHGCSTGAARYSGVCVKPEDMFFMTRLSPASVNACELSMAAIALGAGEAVLAMTKEYVLARTRYKKPLASFQVVANHIAKMATDVEASRALLYDACRMFDEKELDPAEGYKMSNMAKVFTTTKMSALVDQCMQLYGGIGMNADNEITRFWGDVRCTRMGEHADDVLWDAIALSEGMPIETHAIKPPVEW